MVIFGLVQRIYVGKVGIMIVRAVIGYHVKHDPDISFMTSGNQRLELVSRAKMRVDLLPVESTVPVVVLLGVHRDG